MDVWNTVGLIVAGLVAGTINTIAGGGSLLSVPLLVALGLPGDVANGTNRVGILAIALVGLHIGPHIFRRHHQVNRLACSPKRAPKVMSAIAGFYCDNARGQLDTRINLAPF